MAVGADGLIDFNIEGDVGGDDPQMQSLSVYQASGGLGTKEYYEEKPILDLYHSVLKGILIDVVSHSDATVKRGLAEDVIETLALEAEKWPYPWPGNGGGGGDGDGDGDDNGGNRGRPGKGGNTPPTEPLADRMDKLASKIVEFERELVRAGADLEMLFNPHYSYNPYSTKQVATSLPFLDIPTYLSTFAIRSFPTNMTVTYPPYLHAVTHLVDTTPDYVLSGYFAIRLAMTHGMSLGDETGVWQSLRRLQEVLMGLAKGTKQDRQNICLGMTDQIVGYIGGGAFVQKAFSPEAREDAENIIKCETFATLLPVLDY